MQGKNALCARLETSIKLAYKGRGCILIEVRKHMDYICTIGDENLFSL